MGTLTLKLTETIDRERPRAEILESLAPGVVRSKVPEVPLDVSARVESPTVRLILWFRDHCSSCRFGPDEHLPFQDRKVLIGAQDFEAAVGIGFIRAYDWGTLNYRVSLGFDGAERKFELGEYAIEYLKRVNDRWRFVATLEGEDDEVSLIGEAQITLRPGAILKLNSGFGLTEKASDIAPEIGVLFTF